MISWTQRSFRAFISRAFGHHFEDPLEQRWKVKTVFPCVGEHQNQALEAMLLVMLFVIFTHMLSGALFSMFSVVSTSFESIWSPVRLHSGTPFVIISTMECRAPKSLNSLLLLHSCGTLLWPMRGQEGTGLSWELSGLSWALTWLCWELSALSGLN